jgi:hypothetical protein
MDVDSQTSAVNGTTNGMNGHGENRHGENGHDQVNGDGLPKKKLTLSFEEYKALSNTLIVYMRNEELALESGIVFKFVSLFCFNTR